MISKIYLDVPRWFYSRRSTDWRMKLNLARILFPSYEVMARSVWFSIFYNAQYLVPRFLPKRLRHSFALMCITARARILSWIGAKVVVSQGGEPPLPSGARVIWETYFLEPQPGELDYGEAFHRGCDNYWMKCMENYGGKVFRIGVRGGYSVALVKRHFPEFANKVVDLGFVYDECSIPSEEEVVKKQQCKSTVQILFVGRQAKLKGVVPLVDALVSLRKAGVCNFKLTLVSTFRDGVVSLPNEEWVEHLKEVSHEEALHLFRQAQIFVMPTFRDSYGLVYHEALANGCVTCVSKREPQMEFVDYGKAGVILDPFSSDTMAEKLKEIIMNEKMRVELAVAGRRRYIDIYSQQVIRKRWLNVLEEASHD